MNAIELKNVSFSYDGKNQILDSVNAAMSYGEVNLIAGHSGEGKSTLLYIISGIIPNITYGKLSGEVLVGGEDIKGKTPRRDMPQSRCRTPKRGRADNSENRRG